MKRVPVQLNRERAHQILDGMTRGKYVSRIMVDHCLRATGDLPPEASKPFTPQQRRYANYGRTA